MDIRNVVILSLFSILISGCGVMGWKSDYACPGMPNGVVCKSPIEVYKMTENADSVVQETEPGGASKESVQAANSAFARLPGQVTAGRSMTKDAQPVLEPARVMRVWIAPWIDSKQDLHMPGYVFTEVTPRRWSFGEATAVRGARPLVPVQSDLRGNGDGDSSIEVGNDTKVLTPKGLVQGIQRQNSNGGQGAPGWMPNQSGSMTPQGNGMGTGGSFFGG